MTFDWQHEYASALQLFGDTTPGATLEQELVDRFQQHPQAVTNAITKIGKAYAAGKIRSPWGALKAEIPKQIDRDIRVGDGHERNNAIACAEQWLKTAGLHFDRWTEAHDELFGDHGKLRPWARDHALTERMRDLYEELRPLGVITETEELERAEHWKNTREAVLAKPKTKGAA